MKRNCREMDQCGWIWEAPFCVKESLIKECAWVHLLLFSCLLMSNSLQLHELQHTRLPTFFTISCSLLRLMSMESVMPSNHLILCHPLLLLLSISPSIRVFSSESALHIRWPKYWSFSFSISPSNEYSGMVSCRIDWFDLLVVQRTLKEFSPVQQFESINSLALSLLNGITLTSTPEYWKNHSFDYMDLCRIVISAF